MDTTQNTIVAQKNFWAPKTAEPRLNFFPCKDISKGCLGGNESNSLVSRCDAEKGYSDSTLCAVCVPGKFVRDGSSCAMCGDRSLTLAAGLVATSLFCAFVYVEMSRADTDAEDQTSTRQEKKLESEVVQRIAISHVVMLSSIGDLSVKGPALLRNMFDTLDSLSSGVSMSSSSARCVLGLNIYLEVFGNFLLVLFLPMLIALGMKVHSVITRQPFKSNLLVSVVVFVVYLKYTSVLQSLLSLCKCTESILEFLTW